MPVLYDSKRLLPVHQVGIEKEYTRGQSGRFGHILYVVTVNGHLVATKGSPDHNGSFWGASGEPPDASQEQIADLTNRLEFLRNKKGALQKIFETRGKFFEIIPHNATTSVRFIPRVRSITFQQGTPQTDWLEKIPYTIVMETDDIQFGPFSIPNNEKPKKWDCDETWNIEPNDERNRTYKVTHTLSATGFDQYDEAGTGELIRKGWKVARDDKVLPNSFEVNGFVIEISKREDEDEEKVDIRTETKVGSPNLATYEKYNFVKTELIDEPNGRYTLTETWILYEESEGPYLEEYTVTTRISAEDAGAQVTVDGTITGFNTMTPPGLGDRYENAELGWEIVEPLIISRAQAYSGKTLNAVAVGKTFGKNPLTGVITYNYEFSDKPTSSVAGAISDITTVNDNFPTEVIAKHVCVLRPIGPVLQDIFTQTESRRNLTIEVQMPRERTDFTPSKPDVGAIIAANTPTASYEGPYIDKNEETWTVRTGKYTRVVSWIWV